MTISGGKLNFLLLQEHVSKKQEPQKEPAVVAPASPQPAMTTKKNDATSNGDTPS